MPSLQVVLAISVPGDSVVKGYTCSRSRLQKLISILSFRCRHDRVYVVLQDCHVGSSRSVCFGHTVQCVFRASSFLSSNIYLVAPDKAQVASHLNRLQTE